MDLLSHAKAQFRNMCIGYISLFQPRLWVALEADKAFRAPHPHNRRPIIHHKEDVFFVEAVIKNLALHDRILAPVFFFAQVHCVIRDAVLLKPFFNHRFITVRSAGNYDNAAARSAHCIHQFLAPYIEAAEVHLCKKIFPVFAARCLHVVQSMPCICECAVEVDDDCFHRMKKNHL